MYGNIDCDTGSAYGVYNRFLVSSGSMYLRHCTVGSSSYNNAVYVGTGTGVSNTTMTVNGKIHANGNITCSGTKSRRAETEDYGDRLLYCYETPTPMFGDIGSSQIGEDGTAYVSIDDVFAEAARTDLAYQVFLQRCGEGDLWVAEKAATHFVVRGTPGLPFDWEIKARQVGFEDLRLEDASLSDAVEDDALAIAVRTEAAYGEQWDVSQMEALYEEEIEALYEEIGGNDEAA